MERKSLKRKLGASVAAMVAVAAAFALLTSALPAATVVDDRIQNFVRPRMDWDMRRTSLSEREFRRRYRLSKKSFEKLAAKIYPYVARQPPLTEAAVSCELCLSMSLRYLAGGHYIDIADMHGVAPATFYQLLWLTVEAINKVETMAVPWFDEHEGVDSAPARTRWLHDLARGFNKRHADVAPGCVGALDGIAIWILKPWLIFDGCPMTYYNRKGFFALNVRAICDSNYRFLWMSAKARGSSHDSTAWMLSHLAGRFEAEPLSYGFWIAGDEAYRACNWLLTPWSGKNLVTYKDAFNYYQSSNRIHIEQAFGIYVRRWGVLHRQLTCNLDRASLVVQVTMKLHNICIDDKVPAEAFCEGTTGYRDADADRAGFSLPYDQGDCATEARRSGRRDTEQSGLRLDLTNRLEENQCRRATQPLRGGFRPYYA